MNGSNTAAPASASEQGRALGSARRFAPLLAWIGLAAFALRLAHVWFVTGALGRAQIHDAAYYHDVALSLLGHLDAPELTTDVPFANVGYPYVLSWVYSLVANPTAMLVLQSALGAATTVLVGLVARESFASRRVGLLAAGLSAVYAPAIFYDGLLLIPSSSAFLSALLAWSLLRAVRPRGIIWAAVCGLAIGAATLLRSSQLLLLVPTLVVLQRSSERAAAPRGRLAEVLPRLSVLLLATLVCLAPLVLRQWRGGDEWVPVTANGGMNFWIGNHQGASGRYTQAAFLGASKGGDFTHTLVVEREKFLAEARRRTGDAELSLGGADAFWWGEGVREVAEEPLAWVRLLGKKVLATANDYEPRTNVSFELLEEVSPVLRWDPLRFGMVWALGLVGMTQLKRRRYRRAVWVLGSLAAVPLFTCVVFFVSGEYRHPAFPILVPLAAFGLHRLLALSAGVASSGAARPWPTCRTVWWRWVVVASGAAVAYAGAQPFGLARDRKAYAEALSSPGRDGAAPTREGYDRARALLERVGESREDRVLAAEATLLVLSNQAIQFADRDAALELIQTARDSWQQELAPDGILDASTVSRIRSNLVRRIAQLARQPFVRQWPDIEEQLAWLGGHAWREAATLLEQERWDEAEAFLHSASTMAPHSVWVLAYRGQLEMGRQSDPAPWLHRSLEGYPKIALPSLLLAEHAFSQRDPARAIATLQRAVERGPYDETLHYALGRAMVEHSTPEQLIAFFTAELPRDAKPQTSHYFLALGHERLGNVGAAAHELQAALAIDPAHEMSQHQWGLLLERQGNLVPALEHLVEATRIHPEYRPALLDVARLAERLGHPVEATRWRERASRANPTTERRFVYWARYLHDKGRDAAALNELERRLAAAPRDPEALELRRKILEAGRTKPDERSALALANPADLGSLDNNPNGSDLTR